MAAARQAVSVVAGLARHLEMFAEEKDSQHPLIHVKMQDVYHAKAENHVGQEEKDAAKVSAMFTPSAEE